MKIYFVLLSVARACLAACSSGPSTSEAKEAVLSQIGGGCSRLSIKDFEKVNGAADGGTTYQISVKYLLVVEPPAGSDDSQDAFDARAKDIEQRTQQAQQGLKNAQTADDAFENTPHPAGWYPKAADLDQENALLSSLPQVVGIDILVPAPQSSELSDMALTAVLKRMDRMDRPDLTQHGFRSTFRDWAGETTAYQFLQPLGEQVSGEAKPLLEIIEARHAAERLPTDEKASPLTDEVD